MLTQVSKHVKNGAADASAASLVEQQMLFRDVFGGEEELPVSRLFNMVLALEEIDRFEDACFYNWHMSFVAEEAVPEKSDFPSEVALALQLGPGESAWLEHSWLAAPEWIVLLSHGPWEGDPLGDFVRQCLEPFVGAEETVPSLLAMREHFRDRLSAMRSRLQANFQPEIVLLVEGATEAILIPHFATLLKIDANVVLILACGGAKQLQRRYIALSDITRLPVWCLMDRDADEQIAAVQELLRPAKDQLHVWHDGEIEDSLSVAVLLRHLNMFLSRLGAASPVLPDEFEADVSRTSSLDRIWRSRGLGDFDKVGFAKYLAEHMSSTEVPEQVKHLLRLMISHVGAAKNGRT
ncbi:MAG: hypothetical protein K2W95_02130 [Candidatus Obscuribacterales bacterium]|nr:hypothetical protein [Candidatus Obscuribacterales bacterium]